MRHVGASAPPPPAGSAAGVSSLCSSRQIRAAAPKATTQPASESGKNIGEGAVLAEFAQQQHSTQEKFTLLCITGKSTVPQVQARSVLGDKTRLPRPRHTTDNTHTFHTRGSVVLKSQTNRFCPLNQVRGSGARRQLWLWVTRAKLAAASPTPSSRAARAGSPRGQSEQQLRRDKRSKFFL